MTKPNDKDGLSSEHYRFRLLVTELRREAERQRDDARRSELDAIARELDLQDTVSSTMAARISTLASHFGRELTPASHPARWQSFLRFTGPGLLVLVFIAVLFERRRRRAREVSTAALARLETDSGANSRSD